MSTLTLQPDETDGLDTFHSRNNPDTNYGTNALLRIGAEAGSATSGHLKFSGLSSILPTAIINSATLTLYCSAYGINSALNIHGCLKDWVEAQATANIYATGLGWAAQCGLGSGTDRDASAAGSLTIAGTGAQDITIATSIIQDWVTGARANYGFLMYQTYVANNVYNDFVSSSGATASQRPKLVIEYTLGGQFIRWSNE